MSAIAKACDMGMGTIYNRFPNKEILVNEIFLFVKIKISAVYIPYSSNESIKVQFFNDYKAVVQFFINNPYFFSFFEQFSVSPIITQESKDKVLITLEPVINLLSIGQEKGKIKMLEMNFLIDFISGSFLPFVRSYFNSKVMDEKALQNQLNLVWDAIKV